MNKNTKLAEGDFRNILPRLRREAMEKNQALVDLLKRIAGEKSATPAQIALARLLGRSPGSCRFPAPPSCILWKKISRRLMSS
jgi:aryl-alcohol dehydrogenase-like predicted oxidoreductase